MIGKIEIFLIFLRKACITMNFPLTTAFAVFHKFCMDVFSLSLVSTYFLVFFISSLTRF